MKKTVHSPSLASTACGMDLILFARHMQETARTSAARRLFGRFLEVELDHWRGGQAALRDHRAN